MDDESRKTWLLQKDNAEIEFGRLQKLLEKHAQAITAIAPKLEALSRILGVDDPKRFLKGSDIEKHLDAKSVSDFVSQMQTQYSLYIEAQQKLGR